VSKVENGNTVSVHYRGTLNDGEQFDSSYDRDEPIEFTVGTGQMISGFENEVMGMEVGEKKTFTLTPDQAYGVVKPEAIQTVNKNRFPPDFEFIQDGQVQGQTGDGQTFMA
jgi:peptidylprolyl isomerase